MASAGRLYNRSRVDVLQGRDRYFDVVFGRHAHDIPHKERRRPSCPLLHAAGRARVQALIRRVGELVSKPLQVEMNPRMEKTRRGARSIALHVRTARSKISVQLQLVIVSTCTDIYTGIVD